MFTDPGLVMMRSSVAPLWWVGPWHAGIMLRSWSRLLSAATVGSLSLFQCRLKSSNNIVLESEVALIVIVSISCSRKTVLLPGGWCKRSVFTISFFSSLISAPKSSNEGFSSYESEFTVKMFLTSPLLQCEV